MNRYEELRALALKRANASSVNSFGLSILLLRGMTSWVETLTSELSYPFQEDLSLLLEQPLNDMGQSSKFLFPRPIREEITMVLTNMVMYQQKNDTNKGVHHA
jgi:hypothetical protein